MLGHVQEQQDIKERRKQQNICESCFEEHQLVFLAPCGCSTIRRDCAVRISSCPSIGCGKEIKHICSTREEVERKVAQQRKINQSTAAGHLNARRSTRWCGISQTSWWMQQKTRNRVSLSFAAIPSRIAPKLGDPAGSTGYLLFSKSLRPELAVEPASRLLEVNEKSAIETSGQGNDRKGTKKGKLTQTATWLQARARRRRGGVYRQ